VIAPRIAATQREKAAAEAVLASAPPTPQPLTLDEVIETLSMLRDLPELLGAVEQADRAALYQALGLHVTYRRVGAVEQVRLRTSLRAVDLERVGVRGPEKNSLVPALRSVDLERVGGGLSHIRHARRSGIWPLDQELVLLGSIRLRGVSATKAYAPTDRDTRFPVRSAPTRGAWRQRWPSQTGGPRKHATPSTASRSAACLTSIRHDSLRTVRHCLTRMIPGTLVNGGRAHATKRIHRHRGRSGAWSLRCARRRRLSSDCELRRRSRSVATSSSPLWLDTLAYASATTSNDGAVHVAEGMSCATVRLDARSRAHPSGH
jgi:hypothetical protein